MLVFDRAGWRDAAACRGRVELFFPAFGERELARSRRVRAARELCAGCPVASPCREFAAVSGQPWGVWGGVDVEAPVEVKHRPYRRAGSAR